MTTALVTGAAGFIGFHLCRHLLAEGWTVIGFDAVTDYYDPQLKEARLDILRADPKFTEIRAALETPGALDNAFAQYRPDVVVHLAAQAGVRYSLEAPESYVNANLIGTFRVLEAARAYPPAHLLMASTSSVYGANDEYPYAEAQKADSPMSFYAATKKANEAMAHSYAHLYGLPITMFRFFTVYGPWGRPDMALFKFTNAILKGEPIDIYNHGQMERDFTYIDDLVEAVLRLIPAVPVRGQPVPGDSLSPVAPWRVVNIGNDSPVPLMEYVAAVEDALGTKAQKNMMPIQPGEVPRTWADVTLLHRLTGFRAKTDVATGVRAFVDWYRGFYGA
ncbi:SDR family NAD(P)-dependent oxidoreductase [Paracoccus pacificus]|uniref:SDR family NAD(P)-dependent oxidoreductase n=1 Tax=Paracoccus pacificus TaxID=1463598 RepID=A0ABW4R778_9RHOB